MLGAFNSNWTMQKKLTTDHYRVDEAWQNEKTVYNRSHLAVLIFMINHPVETYRVKHAKLTVTCFCCLNCASSKEYKSLLIL